MKKDINNVAIIGMGALGLLYGEHITNELGKDSVSYILDEDRYKKYQEYTFTCNDKILDLKMQKSDNASFFDLVIVAVKFNSLESALKTMENCVGPDTIIMSVMNGINSEEIIAQKFGKEKLIYTVAQQMDALREGTNLHYSKKGILCIGKKDFQDSTNLNTVCRFFDKIKMPYKREENILYRIWAKWMLNVGINQTCAVFNTNYSQTLEPGTPRDTFIAAMKEVVELSKYEGINLADSEVQTYLDIIASLESKSCPSMAQDRIAKRKSELEMFSGTVIRLAEKHHLDVPVNRFLYSEMKKIEETY